MKKLIQFSACFVLCQLLFLGCAQRGNPSGGPKDTQPPTFVDSYPDTLATNVAIDIKEIQIDFDEYLILKEYNKQVIVSPPLEQPPVFAPLGTPKKYISIELNSKLKENTTYSFSFNEAIQDFNENNTLSGFKYVFSTGDKIDSLQIVGKVKNSFDADLPKDIVVALYKIDSAYTDSLLLKSKPYYVSRTNEKGEFMLDYLNQGSYHIFAYNDKIPDLQFQAEQELIGFAPQAIDLQENLQQNMTLFPQVLPYRAKEAEQIGYGQIRFRFQGQPEKVSIKALERTFTTKKIIFKPKTDSLEFWFNQSIDSLGNKNNQNLKFLVEHLNQQDTIRLLYKQNQEAAFNLSETKKGRYAPNQFFQLKSNYPIQTINPDFISVVQDSTPINFTAKKEENSEFRINFDFPLEFQKKYKVQLLPGAVTNFFNQKNDTLQYDFRIKSERQFGNLKLKLQNAPKHKFWLQLLSNQNKIIEESYTQQKEFEFKYLLPGKYTFKILVDENGNGFWDKADFFTRKTAEKVYHYPTKLDVRAFWDLDETWVLKDD